MNEPVCTSPLCDALSAPELQLEDRLQAFACDLRQDQTALLTNRNLDRMEITFHRMALSDLDAMLRFQDCVVSQIPHVEENNLFQSLSREEFSYALRHDICIGAYHDSTLAGLLVLIPAPTAEQNLLLDLPEYADTDPARVLVVDAVLVAGTCRGFGLQRTFYRLADFISMERGMKYECSVVSPLNTHSLNNTLRSGFRLVGNFRKYRSTRNFFVKELPLSGSD